jgi:DNA-directed RNA polymerase specialized sigma24 family protein
LDGEGAVFLVDEVADQSTGPDPLRGRWEAFHAAVDGLPDEEREVFRLVWYLGLEQDDVAKALDWSPRTVRRRWKDARDSIRRAVDVAG